MSLPQASKVLGSKNRHFLCSIHTDNLIGLAVKEEWKDRLCLQAEDYLLGLISLVNELVSSVVLSFCLRLTLWVVTILRKCSYNGELRGTYQNIQFCQGWRWFRFQYLLLDWHRNSEGSIRWIFDGKPHGRSLRGGGNLYVWTTDGMQLNLKNDVLRRRFDSLKYDIKKIEEGKHIIIRFGYMWHNIINVWTDHSGLWPFSAKLGAACIEGDSAFCSGLSCREFADRFWLVAVQYCSIS